VKKVIGALAAALVAASLVAPAAAKPRLKVAAGPKQLPMFLRWDGDGAGGCGATYLSREDAPDEGNGCAFIFQAAQEVLIASGQGALSHEWPGLLDKPVKLSAGKVTGEFEVKAYAGIQATLEVVLTASTKKGSTEVGTYTSPAFNTVLSSSTGTVPISFEFNVPKALVNKKVTAFNLTTTFRGVSQQSYIELDAPPARLIFPIK
jgi:hypothetical protein